jgi:4-hydroxybenzoate polyprenyltransferase
MRKMADPEKLRAAAEASRAAAQRWASSVLAVVRRVLAWAQAAARHHWPALRNRLLLWSALMRLDRPVGALLLLWPTLWGLWIAAGGVPSLHLLLVFVAGVFLTRSAGCVLNDLADRRFDPHVQRTRDRPLATGAVRPSEALLLAAALLAAAFLLVLTTNRLTVLLSIAAVPLAALYPFMKRYTYVPQFFLGIAFSWGIPMAFAAQSGTVPPIAWLLFIGNVLWAAIYDTIYAMVDRDDDLRIGVKSTAILFGDADRTIIGVMQAMMLLVFLLLGRQLELGNAYYGGLAVAAALMIHHQVLIRDRRRERCFRAFLNNNWLGFAIFAGIAAHFILAP